jgi:capsular polysaccharide biosynthesis protein
MINLLPPDVKSGYQYGRRNVVLRKWVVICAIALIGLGALATYGSLSLHQSTLKYQKQIASSQALLQKENYSGTQTQIQDFSSSFKLVLQVLGNEVLFSQLLKQIASTIPSKATLSALTIGQTQGGSEITANAPDYTTATQVQVNLSDPSNKIFSKADIQNINCSSGNTASSGYPCTVNIRALFASNNPFLFINSKAKQ